MTKTFDRKRDMFTKLNKLAELCLNIANIIDRQAEENNMHTFIDELGLGYRAADGYLREGVRAIIDIQTCYQNAVDDKKLAEIGEQEANDFVKDIFGDEDASSINDKDKERIKEFVQSIYKEWEETDEMS